MTSETFNAALAHHEAGRLDAARALYREVLARDPDHAESLHLLGLLTAQYGEPDTGEKMIRRAMVLLPGRAPHHNSLATVYRLLGRDADALTEYRAAAALRPLSAEIHNNLATTLRSLGFLTEAIEQYRRAAEYGPEIAEVWCNLAGALSESGDKEETETCFRRAISLRPDYAAAHGNFGRWLTTQGRWLEARLWLGLTVRLTPEDTGSWNNLGVVEQELGHAAEAETNYRRAIALDPNFADAHFNFGCLLAGDGRNADALTHHAAAVAADPLHGAARLALCMARLPIVYRNEAEIVASREKYLAALDDLATSVETPSVARAVAGAIGTSQPFFLPYQGGNDREPQAKFGQLACRLLAGTHPLAIRPSRGERIRLGIVSGYYHDHTIFRLFLQGWLTELDRDRFEVIAFHTGRARDQYTARAAGLSDRFVHGPLSSGQWRQVVTDAAPHVLLYPEIGMDPTAARLAAQRLAPVQCVAWGHPETTGMPTMDYFLSSDLMEPPGADAHYTEQLVRLPGLGLHYTPDEEPAASINRGRHPVYWSGQALYKYLPRYDHVFPRIALEVGQCRFVFIGFARSEAVTASFRARLTRAFADFGLDAGQYCVVLPPMPQQRFIAEAGAADVILDTPGWSGGRSTLDSLACDPAIVTIEGQFMRGRHTAAILRRIGCEETIARSLDDYVAIAVRLGQDTEWRASVRLAVREQKYLAFRDTAPVRALEAFLTEAVSRV